MSLSLAAGLLLASAPLAAQEAERSDEAAAIGETIGEMFAADPLDAEQEARLPTAKLVANKLMPPGTYMKMMDETLGPMMDGIIGQVSKLPFADLVRLTGLPESEIQGLGEGTLGEVMAIIDPVHEERQKVIVDATMGWMSQLMDQMEPSFRAGLARAYAVRFTQAELAELDAFFATPTGAHYASESMLIMTDPQVMAAMGEFMPKLVDSMPDMMAEVQEKSESLPPPRKVEGLSEEEQARLRELLGGD